VKYAPDVHADAVEPGQTVQQQQQDDEQLHQQQWWAQDADAWQELLTPAEVTAYMTSTQAAPAWPALASTTLSPKLKLLEFYAGWCVSCTTLQSAEEGVTCSVKQTSSVSLMVFFRASID
jgi:thiol:disulfide interchange protein